jgi:hypothetical protein
MRKTLTVEERREFYKQVSKELAERLKSYPIQPDVDVPDDDDYDGGRYDFYTTRGVK